MTLWILIAVAAALGVVAAYAGRRRLRFYLRVAKAVTRDERLPRPLRWAASAALAIKTIPLPDFGIDELALSVVALLLVTVYRPTFRLIVAECREGALT